MPEKQQTQQSKNLEPTSQRQATPPSSLMYPIQQQSSSVPKIRSKISSSSRYFAASAYHWKQGSRRLLSRSEILLRFNRYRFNDRRSLKKKTLQGKMTGTVQRQEISEEEKEPLQGKFKTIQRLEPEEEEKFQMKSVVQRQESPERRGTYSRKNNRNYPTSGDSRRRAASEKE